MYIPLFLGKEFSELATTFFPKQVVETLRKKPFSFFFSGIKKNAIKKVFHHTTSLLYLFFAFKLKLQIGKLI